MIQVVPLGAGQDVGRSCILVTLGGKNIMFDCGMHMGYNDDRRFPDFSYISREGKFTELIDCVIVTHFHLDHCGALPYFTEMCGYNGPVYMTHPTKAICPILLEDYRKITVDRKGEKNFFTSQMVKDCMKKVIAVNIHETVRVDDELEIKAYYAGHVLGAAMFYARVGSQSVVYTGDYNMTPDRHLGAAWIDRVRPDILITETTYATTIRDSKRARERDFLKKVHDCVAKGGKVLIPVFALGRAQELCILIDTYWERMGLKIPVYFSAGLTEKANNYYKMFIGWTNEKIKKSFVKRNMFDFKHIQAFERSYGDREGPMVLFASPGMLHAGMSLDMFKKWAPNPLNMVIMPGYCVAGTVGARVLAGEKKIEIDKRTTVDVNLQVKHLSFSAHADAKGIMQLIRQCEPKNVVLVHGEKSKMGFLKEKIIQEFGIPCFDPPNGMTISIPTSQQVPVEISPLFLKRHLEDTQLSELGNSRKRIHYNEINPLTHVPVQGILVMQPSTVPKLLDSQEIGPLLGLNEHKITLVCERKLAPLTLPNITNESPFEDVSSTCYDYVFEELSKIIPNSTHVSISSNGIKLKTMEILLKSKDASPPVLTFQWEYEDNELANKILSVIDKLPPFSF